MNNTIPHLITALQSFENQELEVRISVDGGQTNRPISFVGNNRGRCLLEFCLQTWLECILPETGLPDPNRPRYIDCGKKIPQLIEELQTFEDWDRRIVEISVNDGDNCYPISRIEQSGEYCLLIFDK